MTPGNRIDVIDIWECAKWAISAAERNPKAQRCARLAKAIAYSIRKDWTNEQFARAVHVSGYLADRADR
jgi:hypothetical protein